MIVIALCWLVAIVVSIPLATFVVECVASVFYRNREVQPKDVIAAVLIPAHNEESGLGATLAALQPQLDADDVIVVVADNCSDGTAEIARQAGCVVLERSDANNRGKGFALAYGIDHLRECPPQVVVIVDADCEVLPGTLAQLKSAAVECDYPIQANYLLKAPAEASLPIKVSEFAVLVKNAVRCRGASVLSIPVPLLGSGMAFPWADLADVSIASGEIVEDMKLGIELACEEKGALYLDHARVESRLPSTKEALAKQRERWEHGHLGMIQKFSPPVLKAAWKLKSLPLVGFLLDLIIPPLSLLLVFTVAVFLAFIGLGLLVDIGSAIYLISFMFCAVIASVLAIWWTQGRHILTPKELAAMPLYVLSKFGIYTSFMKGKQTEWKRTDRD